MAVATSPPLLAATGNSLEDARQALGEFVNWVRALLEEINENPGEIGFDGNPLFHETQIAFLAGALLEPEIASQFAAVIAGTEHVEEEVLKNHGLMDIQLEWKLSNVDFHFKRFIAGRTATLLHRLLSAVDKLLKSILKAIPGGEALEELKEAVEGAIDLGTQ